jgi:hypothetical protein
MFTILNGGKEVNSKVKFGKIYLIYDPQTGDNIINAFKKIKTVILKGI